MLCRYEGGGEMRKILEDFYYGNIIPHEQKMAASSDLRRAANKIAQCETQLKERLGEAEQALLAELVKTQLEIDSITAVENFILGFRLGVRMMAECMDENDGDTQEVTDHGKETGKRRGQYSQTKGWPLGGSLHGRP